MRKTKTRSVSELILAAEKEFPEEMRKARERIKPLVADIKKNPSEYITTIELTSTPRR